MAKRVKTYEERALETGNVVRALKSEESNLTYQFKVARHHNRKGVAERIKEHRKEIRLSLAHHEGNLVRFSMMAR